MRNLPSIVILAALCGCANEAQVTQPSDGELEHRATPAYRVEKFSASFGGAQSRGMAINGSSWVAGWSDRADGHRHAALWRNGVITDLQTLGGPSSTVPWPGLNDAGMVAGISHTNRVDPLDEDWSCELGGFLLETTNLICSGFVWQNSVMRELPTLGGNHGFAAGVNNRGKIVGWAETAEHDPTCSQQSAQKLGFRALIWDPKDGSQGKIETTQLRRFRRDAASAATAINDNGQVVGISGDCDQAVGRYSARHAVLWERNGRPREIPNLGGTSWHTPMDINPQGDVAGFSNPNEPGDEVGEFISLAFFWPYGSDRAIRIGALPGDAVSEALALNSRRQVVGVSFGGSRGFAHAFLWENRRLMDLNDLADVAPDVLLSAQDINEAGQITGRVREAATGKVLMFIATPISDE
jgi:probable HAF family extracellular repeat protein